MGVNTGIEWADHSANLWWGCSQVKGHSGCDHCYAKDWEKHYGNGSHWGNKNVRREIMTVYKTLDRVQRMAEREDRMTTVFLGSMMDLFEIDRPTDRGRRTGPIRQEFFQKLTDGVYPNIIFLFLTKRPGNIKGNLPTSWYEGKLPPNLWFGTSVSRQSDVTLISELIDKVPEGVKIFVSVEPMLGYVDLGDFLFFEEYVRPHELQHGDDSGARTRSLIDWIICGGESGKHARPTHTDWIERLASDAETANVPFFFKQWGEYSPTKWGEAHDVIIDTEGNRIADEDLDPVLSHQKMTKYGKIKSGHLFYGEEIRKFPKEFNEYVGRQQLALIE